MGFKAPHKLVHRIVCSYVYIAIICGVLLTSACRWQPRCARELDPHCTFTLYLGTFIIPPSQRGKNESLNRKRNGKWCENASRELLGHFEVKIAYFRNSKIKFYRPVKHFEVKVHSTNLSLEASKWCNFGTDERRWNVENAFWSTNFKLQNAFSIIS